MLIYKAWCKNNILTIYIYSLQLFDSPLFSFSHVFSVPQARLISPLNIMSNLPLNIPAICNSLYYRVSEKKLLNNTTRMLPVMMSTSITLEIERALKDR